MAQAVIYTIFAIFAVYGMYTAAREAVLFISRLRGRKTDSGHSLCGGCRGCSINDDGKEEYPSMSDIKYESAESTDSDSDDDDDDDRDFFPT